MSQMKYKVIKKGVRTLNSAPQWGLVAMIAKTALEGNMSKDFYADSSELHTLKVEISRMAHFADKWSEHIRKDEADARSD